MAQHVLFDAGRVDDRRIQIKQGFAVGKVKRRFGVNLSPDEHVFGRQTDLFVAVADVGLDGVHDFLFRKINLRIQIGHAELAAASATCGHFNHAKSRAFVGNQQSFAFLGMADFDFARQFFAVDCFVKQRHRVG